MTEQLHFHFFTFMHWRRKWQPTPVFLPGESQGQESLVGWHLWGHTESDTTEVTKQQQQQQQAYTWLFYILGHCKFQCFIFVIFISNCWYQEYRSTLVFIYCSYYSPKVKVKVKSLSRVRLLATPWTAAYQAPPSMGFSRQEYWSGVPLPSPIIAQDLV